MDFRFGIKIFRQHVMHALTLINVISYEDFMMRQLRHLKELLSHIFILKHSSIVEINLSTSFLSLHPNKPSSVFTSNVNLLLVDVVQMKNP